MTTLTNETFWLPISEKYPKAMKVFREWINKYKVKNNWDDIFKPQQNVEWVHLQPMKFYDLPDAMQFGMFLEFVTNTIKLGSWHPIIYSGLDLPQLIEEYFKPLEKTLESEQTIKTAYEVLKEAEIKYPEMSNQVIVYAMETFAEQMKEKIIQLFESGKELTMEELLQQIKEL